MMLNNSGISVVIPNFNGRRLLPEILPFLKAALKYSGREYEIIISDDCSTDDSIAFLRSEYPELIVLENKMNNGFSPTINAGIFIARFPFLLLLNSDVKLSEDYFIPLFRYFEREDTFGVMGRIIGWDDAKLQDAAKYPSFHGAKIKTSGNYYLTDPQKNEWLFSMYLSGANAFVSREKIMILGGFDELFAPFYVEDLELSLRAWRLGWKCYYEHDAVCRHQVSKTIRSKNRKAFINTIYYRNKMFLHAIHLNGARLFMWYVQLIPEAILKIFSGRFFYLRSLAAFFKAHNKVLLSKRRFQQLGQKNRFLTVGEVAKIITDPLANKDICRF